MNKLAIFILIGLLTFPTAFAIENKVYYLDFSFHEGNLSLNGVSLVPGFAPDRISQPEKGYLAEVFALNGSMVSSFLFDNPTIINAEGGPIMQKDGNFSMTIDYLPEGNAIRIYNEYGILLSEVNIIQFAKTCSNNICEDHESYESCLQDCPSGGEDDYCDKVKDKICDPDCISKDDDQDCSSFSAAGKYFVVVAVLFLLLCFFVFKILAMKPKKKKG